MSNLKIALLQLASHGLDQVRNLEKGLQMCHKAAVHKPDIILFPELWNIGYAIDQVEDAEELRSYGVALEDNYVDQFRKLAVSQGVAIAVTFVEKQGENIYDTVLVIGKKGEDLLHYAKSHTCDFNHEKYFTPGRHLPVANLPIAEDELQIACMICYDREFPETARLLMLKGAEIVLVPNACIIEMHRKTQLASRAFENTMSIAMANYAAPDQNGNSVAFSGICFDSNGNSISDMLIDSDSQEQILLTEIDTSALRRYRKESLWGDAYRKPYLYGELCSTNVVDVFNRHNSRRKG